MGHLWRIGIFRFNLFVEIDLAQSAGIKSTRSSKVKHFPFGRDENSPFTYFPFRNRRYSRLSASFPYLRYKESVEENESMKRKEVKPLVDIRSCKKYTCKKHDPFANWCSIVHQSTHTHRRSTHTHVDTPIRHTRYLTDLF